MEPDKKLLDVNFCREKVAEYDAKARTATDRNLKAAFEAMARDYAIRSQQLNSTGA
jgi:hypothetical protein